MRQPRRYAVRGLGRPLTGVLVLLGVLVMHGLGIGHGGHLPGHSEAAVQGATAHSATTGHHLDVEPMAAMPPATPAAMSPPVAAATALTGAVVALGATDAAGHAGDVCAAVLPLLLVLLTLRLALAAVHRQGHPAPVGTVRRHRVRGSPPTRHTTSLLQLCVSRT